MRKELRRWLRNLHGRVAGTTSVVRHPRPGGGAGTGRPRGGDGRGRIEQVGPPAGHAHPATKFVHEFLGDTNRLVCRINGGRVLLDDDTCLGRVEAPPGEAVVYVRPHDMTLRPAAEGTGIIRRAQIAGPLLHLVVDIGAVSVDVTLAADSAAPSRCDVTTGYRLVRRPAWYFRFLPCTAMPLVSVGQPLSLAFRREIGGKWLKVACRQGTHHGTMTAPIVISPGDCRRRRQLLDLPAIVRTPGASTFGARALAIAGGPPGRSHVGVMTRPSC